MAEDLRHLDGWVRADRWPHVECPVCLVGHLAPDGMTAVPSAHSSRMYDLTHLPDDLSGTFHGLLRCAVSTCRESVAVAGDYAVDFDARQDDRTQKYDFYRLRFALPALKIILPPTRTPKPVTKAIDSAATIIWADASADISVHAGSIIPCRGQRPLKGVEVCRVFAQLGQQGASSVRYQVPSRALCHPRAAGTISALSGAAWSR